VTTRSSNTIFTCFMGGLLLVGILGALEIHRENRADAQDCLPSCMVLKGVKAQPIGAFKRDGLCYCTVLVLPE
jgi:hypothetical protein